jgi:hypothetical protein
VVAREARVVAEVLAAAAAEAARFVGPAEPGHADTPPLAHHLTHDLVAEDHAVAGPLEVAVEHVQVGAADPARQHAEEELALGRLWIGQLALTQLAAGGFEDQGPHPAVRIATLPRFT